MLLVLLYSGVRSFRAHQLEPVTYIEMSCLSTPLFDYYSCSDLFRHSVLCIQPLSATSVTQGMADPVMDKTLSHVD